MNTTEKLAEALPPLDDYLPKSGRWTTALVIKAMQDYARAALAAPPAAQASAPVDIAPVADISPIWRILVRHGVPLHARREIQELIAAAYPAPAPAPQMVLVPVYPTSEMIDAGRWSEYGEETSRLHEVDDDEVAGVWASMIAAAPSGGSEAAMFIRAREWAERYGRLEAAAEAAAAALEEAQSYTSCETWSPSMTEECKRAAQELRRLLANKD